MTITISLSESDLERIRNVLGIESYDDIHTAFVDAMDIMLEKEEEFNDENNWKGYLDRRMHCLLKILSAMTISIVIVIMIFMMNQMGNCMITEQSWFFSTKRDGFIKPSDNILDMKIKYITIDKHAIVIEAAA